MSHPELLPRLCPINQGMGPSRAAAAGLRVYLAQPLSRGVGWMERRALQHLQAGPQQALSAALRPMPQGLQPALPGSTPRGRAQGRTALQRLPAATGIP